MKKMVSILICALALMVGHIQAQEVELTKEEKKALQEKKDTASSLNGSYQQTGSSYRKVVWYG